MRTRRVLPLEGLSGCFWTVLVLFAQFLDVCTLLLVVRMLLVVRPGAPSSVLAHSSDALCY